MVNSIVIKFANCYFNRESKKCPSWLSLNEFYLGWNSIPNPDVPIKIIEWKEWKLQKVEWVLPKDVSNFNWYIWYDAEDPKDLYFTGVRLSCLPK